MKLKNKNIWCTVMVCLIVAFDQITKYLAKSHLSNSDAVTLIDGFLEFRYAENTGMAFSALSGGRWFFIVLTFVVAIGVIVFMSKKKTQSDLWLFWTLGVLLSGAIGNLIDRVFFGFVIDFINPTFVNFAIFNIADCAVTLGTISLIAYMLFDAFKKKDEEHRDE